MGLGLILGLLTGLTALVGLFLSLNYGLASQWMSFGQQGFHVMLVTSMIVFFFARAGRTWGLDGLILSAGRPGLAPPADVRLLARQGVSAIATPQGKAPHGIRATTVFERVSITASSFARPTVA